MRQIVAFTDGSAVASGKMLGYGGMGAVITEDGAPNIYLSKGFINTKTGRMEITALLCVIKAMPLDEDVELIVYSDSQYVVKAFTEGWLRKWEKLAWIKLTGEDVKNKDLWSEIIKHMKLRPKLKLRMRHIKGHQVDKAKREDRAKMLQDEIIRGNAMADILADYKRHKNFETDLETLN